MKLKTLKDFVKGKNKKLLYTYTNEDVVFAEELKQEAIKHLKKMEEQNSVFTIHAEKWIREFFNIIEGDL